MVANRAGNMNIVAVILTKPKYANLQKRSIFSCNLENVSAVAGSSNSVRDRDLINSKRKQIRNFEDCLVLFHVFTKWKLATYFRWKKSQTFRSNSEFLELLECMWWYKICSSIDLFQYKMHLHVRQSILMRTQKKSSTHSI